MEEISFVDYNGVIFDPPSFITLGTIVNYTYVVHNLYDLPFYNISLTDTLGNSWVIDCIDPGATLTHTDHYPITADDILAGHIASTCTCTWAYYEDTILIGKRDAIVSLLKPPQMMIEKYSGLTNGMVFLGDEVYYTYQFHNIGGYRLTDIVLKDSLGMTISAGEMSIDEVRELSLIYHIQMVDLERKKIISQFVVSFKYETIDLVTEPVRTLVFIPQVPKITISLYDEKPNVIQEIVTESTPPQLTLQSYYGVFAGMALPGTLVAYNYQLQNTGGDELDNVTVIDSLGMIIPPILILNIGDTRTLSEDYSLTQSDINNGQITSQAYAKGIAVSDSSEVTSNMLPTTVIIPQLPAITITSYTGSITSPPHVVGTLINYAITVTNTGNLELTDVTIIDSFGTIYVVGDLAPTISVNIPPPPTFVYPITVDDITNGTVLSTVGAVGNSMVGSVSDQKDTTVDLGPPPSILLQQYTGVIGIPVPLSGTPITYTYVIENTGNNDLTDVKIADVLGSYTYTVGNLLYGQTKTHTRQYLITQVDIDTGYVASTAEVIGTFVTIDVSSSKSLIVTVAQIPSVSVTKVTTLVDDYVGGFIHYTITVKNTGNLNLYQIETVDSLLGLDELIVQLLPNTSAQFTDLPYQITKDDFQRGLVANTVICNGSDSKHRDVSCDYTLSTPLLVNRPSLHIFKVSNSMGHTVGQKAYYTLTVTNNGNVTLTQVHVTDYLLGIDKITSLQSHHVETITGSYTLKQSDIDLHYVTNTANVTGFTPTLQEVGDEVTIVTPIMVQLPSIFLSKIATFSDDWIGGTIQYKLTIVNNGDVPLHSLTLYDAKLGLDEHIEILLQPKMIYTVLRDYTLTESDYETHLVTNIAHATGWDTYNRQLSMTVTVQTVPCVVRDTLVLMLDGQVKPIQDLIRGDIVAPCHRVARLCETPVPSATLYDLMIFKANCLGKGSPKQDLMITSNHPIIYNGARRPARCFRDLFGVSHIKRIAVDVLYDLQFDHDGSYLANGVEIQSCSPYSVLNPLPKDMYFDPSLYTEENVWDTYNQDLKLVTDRVKPLHMSHHQVRQRAHMLRMTGGKAPRKPPSIERGAKPLVNPLLSNGGDRGITYVYIYVKVC